MERMNPRVWMACGLTGDAVWLLFAAADPLARHRNRGKAFYETPAAQLQAVEEFRKALALAPDSARERVNYGLALLRAGKAQDGVAVLERAQRQDPSIPHTWFNLGIAYKREGQIEQALVQFAKLLELAPADPIAHYQYASLARAERPEEAIRHFRRAAELNPALAAPHFQLYNVLRQAGRREEAVRALQTFQELKKRQDGAAVPEDAEWSVYSEVYDIVEPSPDGAVIFDDEQSGDYDNDGLADRCVAGERSRIERGTKTGFTQAHEFPAASFDCLWIDYDHDYDLDVMFFGDASSLYRNEGGAFRKQDFPFQPGRAVAGVVFDLVPDTDHFDLLVAYADRPAVVYRDRLLGQYQAESLPFSLFAPLRAADLNHDQWTDLTAGGRALYNRNGRLEPGAEIKPAAPPSRSLRITLEGVKNAKLAHGAKIEVRAGRWYRKRWYYGKPVRIDLGPHTQADAVRVTWANGLVQNVVDAAAAKPLHIREAPRLMGSCPSVFTWNGSRFEFITDVLGTAPLGANRGAFPLEPDEYIQLPVTAIAGRYEVRITEELREVTYLDQVRLIAIDHPADVLVYPGSSGKFVLYAARPLENAVGACPARLLLARGWVDWPDGSAFHGADQAGGFRFPALEALDSGGRWRTVVENMGIPSGKPKTIVVPLPAGLPSCTFRVRTNLPVHWEELTPAREADLAAVRTTDVPLHSAALRFRGFSQLLADPDRRLPERFDYHRRSRAAAWNQTPGRYTRAGDVRALVERADDRLAVIGSGDEVRLLFDARALAPIPAGYRRQFVLHVAGWSKDADPNTLYGRTVEPLPFRAMRRYGDAYPHQELARRYNTRQAASFRRSIVP
jgi:tetratricopeptide (TPR) repeat protein